MDRKSRTMGAMRLWLPAVATGLLTISPFANANVITINVTDGGPGVNTNATNIGGVVANPYIENIGGGGAFTGKNTTNITNFRDNTGTPTGVGISSSAGWNSGDYQATAPAGFETGPDTSSNEMMQNYTDTSNGTVTFSGLDSWLSAQGATSFEVYVMSDRSVNLYEGSFSIGSQKYWLSNGGNGANGIAGPYLLGTANTLAAAQVQKNTSNYVKFTGLTGDTFTLNVARDTGGSGWLNVNSIQIVATTTSSVSTWGGTVGDWTVPGNWVENSVPVTDGTSDVTISSGIASIAGQLDFTGGSLLTVNGGTLEQTTAGSESLSFQGDSHFSVSDSGALNAQVLLSMQSSSGNSVANGTITTGRLELLGGSSLVLSNNATVTANSGQTSLDGGSNVSVSASTLNLKDLSLGSTGGSPSTVGVGNGALVKLDAAGLGTATDVITVSGSSFVNFPGGTTGTVFIDHISLAQVEAMIVAGKFGLGGVRYINPAGYSLFEVDSGIEIAEGFQTLGIVWGGTNDNWSVGSNWVGGEVPRITGRDGAVISSGNANYLGQLTFSNGSQLTLDGGTLTQTTAGSDYLRFHEGGKFTISNSGSINAQVRLRIWRSAGNTVDNGTITAGQLQVDDNASLTLGNGAVVTATTAQTILNNNSWIEIGNGTTLTLRDVFLGAWGGAPCFIRVLDGGVLRLNAAGLTSPTDVIAIEGGSFINLPSDTTGNVFIDNISQADFQALIAAGKFGIDQSRITDTSRYQLTAQGSGFVIHGLSVPAGPGPQIASSGFNVDGDFEIQVTGLDPSKSYTLVRGTDLLSFPVAIGAPVTGTSGHTFVDSAPPAGKAFYRLEWTTP